MIAVFGGTFDPVHTAHLMMAQAVRVALGINALRLLPCGNPPHRAPTEASVEQRRSMLEIALEDQPGLIMDDRELSRPGPSYMVDTLASLRQQYPTDPIVLVIGLDALGSLHRWHRWQALFQYAHILVLARPGYRVVENDVQSSFLSERWSSDINDLQSGLSGRIMLLDTGLLDISSTQIRQMISRGEDVADLLPTAVYAFIQANGLYQDKGVKMIGKFET